MTDFDLKNFLRNNIFSISKPTYFFSGLIVGVLTMGWFRLDSFLEIRYFMDVIGTIGLVYVALYGLNTWRKQSKYDKAVKHCSKVYELVSEIRLLRHPLMTAREQHDAAEALGLSTAMEDMAKLSSLANKKITAQVYHRRFTMLQPTVRELSGMRPEITVIWDEEVGELVYDLLEKTYEIKLGIDTYAGDTDSWDSKAHCFVGKTSDSFMEEVEAIALQIRHKLFKGL